MHKRKTPDGATIEKRRGVDRIPVPQSAHIAIRGLGQILAMAFGAFRDAESRQLWKDNYHIRSDNYGVGRTLANMYGSRFWGMANQAIIHARRRGSELTVDDFAVLATWAFDLIPVRDRGVGVRTAAYLGDPGVTYDDSEAIPLSSKRDGAAIRLASMALKPYDDVLNEVVLGQIEQADGGRINFLKTNAVFQDALIAAVEAGRVEPRFERVTYV